MRQTARLPRSAEDSERMQLASEYLRPMYVFMCVFMYLLYVCILCIHCMYCMYAARFRVPAADLSNSTSNSNSNSNVHTIAR